MEASKEYQKENIWKEWKKENVTSDSTKKLLNVFAERP